MSTIKPGDVMLTKSCRMVRVLASRDDGAVAMRDYRSRVAVRSVDTDRLSYHSEHELTLVQPPATPQEPDAPVRRKRQLPCPGCVWEADRVGEAWQHASDCRVSRASTPSPEGQTTWQTLDTAPKDGTWFLAHRPAWALPEIVRWSSYCGGYWQSMETSVEPTHWMPLPSPPTPEGTQP